MLALTLAQTLAQTLAPTLALTLAPTLALTLAPTLAQTLAHAPATDVSGVNDSPFSALEALIETGDSDRIEAAYSKLSPEQRDQFSSMAI